jgi:hypothetical protein
VNLEELLRNERSRIAPNPMDARLNHIVGAVRRRRRLRAGAAGGAAAAALAGAAVVTTQLAPPQSTVLPAQIGRTTANAPAPRIVVDGSWGSNTPFAAVDGVPYAGTEPWSHVARIGSFTVVASGVVYIDPATSQVIRERWDHQTTVIGQAPWHGEGDTSQGGVRNHQSGQYRDLVGSASGDLVTWVERNGDQRGDLIVMDAGTGTVLARTTVPGPPEQPVLIAGVDDDTVHFGVGSTRGPIPASNMWVWRWADEAPPRGADQFDEFDLVLDVSGDTWAVDVGGGMQFQDAAGNVLSALPASYEDGTLFGSALSPDGQFWYGPAHYEVVVTSTGERIPTPGGSPTRYGWTGPTELTFIQRGLKVCDGTTGGCTESIPLPPGGPCMSGDPYCGYDLPAY